MLISLKYKIRAPPFSAHWALMYFAHVLRRPYLLLILLQILSLIVPPHLFPLSPSPQPLPVCQSGLSCEPKVECFWILIASCTSSPPPPLLSLQEWQVIPWSTLHGVIYIQIEVQKDWCVLPPWFVCLSLLFVPVQACVLCSIRRSCSCVGPKCYRGALLLL